MNVKLEQEQRSEESKSDGEIGFEERKSKIKRRIKVKVGYF